MIEVDKLKEHLETLLKNTGESGINLSNSTLEEESASDIIDNIITSGYAELSESLFEKIYPAPYSADDSIENGNISTQNTEYPEPPIQPTYKEELESEQDFFEIVTSTLVTKQIAIKNKYPSMGDIFKLGIPKILIHKLPLFSQEDYFNSIIGEYIRSFHYRGNDSYDKYEEEKKECFSKAKSYKFIYTRLEELIGKEDVFYKNYDSLESLIKEYVCGNNERYLSKFYYYEKFIAEFSFSKNRSAIIDKILSRHKYNKYYYIYSDKRKYEILLDAETLIDEAIKEYNFNIKNLTKNFLQYNEEVRNENLLLQQDYEARLAKHRHEIEQIKNNILEQQQLIDNLKTQYTKGDSIAIEEFNKYVLLSSKYSFTAVHNSDNLMIEYRKADKLLLVEMYLPSLEDMPKLKQRKYVKSRHIYEDILHSERELNTLYDKMIYAITIRSIMEICHYDKLGYIDSICYNGRVKTISKSIGKEEDNCIISLHIKKVDFQQIDPLNIDAKACFKYFKGVSASKLASLSPVVPIIEFNKTDKRFTSSHSVDTDNTTNLATMDWEDFEHLIRELFEKEFQTIGGEVKVTQASRDGGVDAIAFDPNPIRGGKIVIQAKRYTNTVGVSAVRDLYGTVLNEGANKGILVTTSDYGADSYEFAKGKPLTLLNGGHVLYLLEKHGQKARIDIEEAKSLYKDKVL